MAAKNVNSDPKNGYLILPKEIVLDIIGYLPEDVNQLRLVNRATNALVGPPRCMVLDKPCQSALLGAVRNAMNASPESVSNLRKLVIVAGDRNRNQIAGFWLLGPGRPGGFPAHDKFLVPAIAGLMTKLNSGFSPRLETIHLDVFSLTEDQRFQLGRLLSRDGTVKWPVSKLSLVGQIHYNFPLTMLVGKVRVLTAVEADCSPSIVSGNVRGNCVLWNGIFAPHAVSLRKAACLFSKRFDSGMLTEAVDQLLCFKQCTNLEWLILRCVPGYPGCGPGLCSPQIHDWTFPMAQAVCEIPSLKRLAMVFHKDPGLGRQWTTRAKQAIHVVMAGAPHLERFLISGPGFEAWEGCRIGSPGEVVIQDRYASWQEQETGWPHTCCR
ncbi:uncharacterized protein PG986_014266 [Apiospora aurea]|uniref:F-box domain-containing protein n=1 Tax=Apiospora aurea TaxID=335848 RepID=A0ABR1PSI3_9PEZI